MGLSANWGGPALNVPILPLIGGSALPTSAARLLPWPMELYARWEPRAKPAQILHPTGGTPMEAGDISAGGFLAGAIIRSVSWVPPVIPAATALGGVVQLADKRSYMQECI